MTSCKCIWQTFTLFPCKNKKSFIHNNIISVHDFTLTWVYTLYIQLLRTQHWFELWRAQFEYAIILIIKISYIRCSSKICICNGNLVARKNLIQLSQVESLIFLIFLQRQFFFPFQLTFWGFFNIELCIYAIC